MEFASFRDTQKVCLKNKLLSERNTSVVNNLDDVFFFFI